MKLQSTDTVNALAWMASRPLGMQLREQAEEPFSQLFFKMEVLSAGSLALALHVKDLVNFLFLFFLKIVSPKCIQL